MKSFKTYLLLFILTAVFAQPAMAQKTTKINSYFPTVYGGFKQIRLHPRPEIGSLPCQIGTLFNNNDGHLRACFSDGTGTGVWGYPPGVWSQINDDIFITESETNPDLYLGIGTDSPEFKLTIDGDGGILSQGEFGQGATLTTSGSGTRMIWYPRKAAFRAGEAVNTSWDDANIGNYTFATGYGTKASGPYSTAMGSESSATGDNSIAMGTQNTASTLNSIALGDQNTASADNAISIGANNATSGANSVALGVSNTLLSYGSSVAVGESNTLKNKGNVAVGLNNTTSKDNVVSIGNTNTVEANFAGAIGSYNHVKGDAAYSIGSVNRAYGAGSFVLGNWSTASGDYSIAVGNVAVASGKGAVSLGRYTEATGPYSVALGNLTKTRGTGSVAIGDGAWAMRPYAVAIGKGIAATGYGSVAIAIGNQTGVKITQNHTMGIMGGNVGIGTGTPTEKLAVAGNIYATGSITPGSSRALKENIEELSTEEAMDTLKNLNPVKFHYIAEEAKDLHVGFIAEDVPELVAVPDRKGISPMDVVATLTRVVQQQQEELQRQKTMMDQQLQDIETLKQNLNSF